MYARNIKLIETKYPSSSPHVPADLSNDQELIPFPAKLSTEGHTDVGGSPRTVSHHRRSIRDLSSEYEAGMAFQRYLQGVFSTRLLSMFFTLHVRHQEEPLYVSEILQGTVNPQFKDLESLLGDGQDCVISIWGKAKIESDFRVIVSEYIYLPDLQFIGSSAISLSNYNFPPNTVIVSLRDGYYVLPKALDHLKLIDAATSNPDSFTQPSLSFDSIMKISNLQACVVDAEFTKVSVQTQISDILSDDKENLFLLRKRRNELQSELKRIQTFRYTQNTKVSHIRKKIQQLQLRIKSSTDAIMTSEARQRAMTRSSTEIDQIITIDKTVILDEQFKLKKERSRIVEDLSFIFPLLPIPGRLLNFTICGLPFVDTNFLPENPDDVELVNLWVKDTFNMDVDDVIGAAYGFACQLVSMLSYYLGVPLRYPIQPFGSQSFIIDPISAIQGSRTFPLWTKGSLYFRFQYAAYLFNKNVEQLLNTQEVMIADIVQVLANLKNLMLILSS